MASSFCISIALVISAYLDSACIDGLDIGGVAIGRGIAINEGSFFFFLYSNTGGSAG